MSVLNHPSIAARYFFPVRSHVRDATLVPIDAGHLTCWRSAPAGSGRPVFVFFHGNGELIKHWRGDFTQAIEAMGFDVFLAEYRGYSESDGSPQLGKLLDDVIAIADVVDTPPEHVVVCGRSVGSIFAVEWIDRFPTTRGLILESGIHDVVERLLLRVDPPSEMGMSRQAFIDEVMTRCDHADKLGRYPGPSLHLHAVQDHIVSIEHARRNANSATHPTLVEMPHGDHNSILAANTTAYFEALRTFLDASFA